MEAQLSVKFTGTTFAELQKAAANFASTKLTAAPTAAPKTTTTKKAAAPVEDDEAFDIGYAGDEDAAEVEDETSFDGADDEVDEAPKAKTKAASAPAKTAKITEKQINAQAIEHAKKHGRKETLKVLKTQFKVGSILELKPEQFANALKALSK